MHTDANPTGTEGSEPPPNSLSALSDVAHLLKYASEGAECYCEDEECCVETPKCRDMHLQAALFRLERVMEPPHESLHPNRLGHDPERIYAEQWKKENERRPRINHGFTLIEWILCPSGQRYPNRVTHREAQVATSVVQWLGTSCGLGFMRICEKLVDQTRQERSSFGDYVNFNHEPSASELVLAELLTGPVAPHLNKKMLTDLTRSIAAALRNERKSAVKSALEAAMV